MNDDYGIWMLCEQMFMIMHVWMLPLRYIMLYEFEVEWSDRILDPSVEVRRIDWPVQNSWIAMGSKYGSSIRSSLYTIDELVSKEGKISVGDEAISLQAIKSKGGRRQS